MSLWLPALRLRLLVGSVAVLGLGGLFALPLAASQFSGGPDLSGVWTVNNTSGPGAGGTLDITDGKGGAFNGTGYGGVWIVRGSVSGDSVHYTVSGQGSYVSTVIGTLSSDGSRITYSWKDTNGAHGEAYLLRGGDNSIKGMVYRVVCGLTACVHKPPTAAIMIVARSAKGVSNSAETDAQGNYAFDHLDWGTWYVTPSLVGTNRVSMPLSKKIIFAEGGSSGGESGIDFNVCNPHPAPTDTDGCEPVFDYTMPARYPDSTLTLAYAQPASFSVVFTVRQGQCDTTASYTWFADGKQIDATPQGHCVFKIDFPKEGTYKVRVEQELPGTVTARTTYIHQVVVQDFLIASLGDSLASGEGNGPYYTNAVFGCDDSVGAYGAQAARAIEDADPRSSVTFLQFACSGATIDSSVNTIASVVKAKGPGDKLAANLEKIKIFGDNAIGPQLINLKDFAGDRQIDALTISIGINNLGFGSIAAECVVVTRCQDPPPTVSGLFNLYPDLGTTVPKAISDLRGLLSALRAAITDLFPAAQLNPADIYVVGYPDPLHNETGALCPVFISNDASHSGGFQNIHGENEVTWAEDAFMKPLENATRALFGSDSFIDPSPLFTTHGYCSTSNWFNHIQDATIDSNKLAKGQGTNPTGVLHPNAEGQTAIANLLLDKMKLILLPGGNARKPA